jgi:hypothetical protein
VVYVLFIVLNEVSYLDAILETFVQVGIGGATVVDSQGMASAIVSSSGGRVPLFGSLKTLIEGARPYNKTIFAVLKSEALVEKAVGAVREVLYDAPPTGLGLMFTVPVANVYEMVPPR